MLFYYNVSYFAVLLLRYNLYSDRNKYQSLNCSQWCNTNMYCSSGNVLDFFFFLLS